VITIMIGVRSAATVHDTLLRMLLPINMKKIAANPCYAWNTPMNEVYSSTVGYNFLILDFQTPSTRLIEIP
jgi:hypothetical protein